MFLNGIPSLAIKENSDIDILILDCEAKNLSTDIMNHIYKWSQSNGGKGLLLTQKTFDKIRPYFFPDDLKYDDYTPNCSRRLVLSSGNEIVANVSQLSEDFFWKYSGYTIDKNEKPLSIIKIKSIFSTLKESFYPIYVCQEPEVFVLVGSTYKNAKLVWITDLPSGYFANDDARLWYNLVTFLAGRDKDTDNLKLTR